MRVPGGASRATRTMARATASALIGRYRASGPTKAQATRGLSSPAMRSMGRPLARAPTSENRDARVGRILEQQSQHVTADEPRRADDERGAGGPGGGGRRGRGHPLIATARAARP